MERIVCPRECRGCRHRDFSRAESLDQKFAWLNRALPGLPIEPVRSVASELRVGYRDKTTLRAEWREGAWKIGLRTRLPGVEDPVVLDLPDCPIHSERIRKLLNALIGRLPRPEKFPLIFLVVSGSLVTFVLKCAEAPDFDLPSSFFADLGFTGAFFNLNPAAGERVFASRGWIRVWGSDTAEFRLPSILGDCRLVHGPESFQQLIPSLYEEALIETSTFLEATEGSAVVDLCSGVGVSVKKWQQGGALSRGVELSGDAVRCADLNCRAGTVLRGRASDRIPQLQEEVDRWKRSGLRLLAYANPPRGGLEPEVVQWLANHARPERIAYLSCSARTLGRDLEVFREAGYRVSRVIPFDFFPRTDHVETLSFLL